MSVRVGGADMETVSAKPLGEPGIVLNETSDPKRLNKIDETARVFLVNLGLATAEQDASRIGTRKRLGELSVELCRRLGWKLQVEPASRLDFSHCCGLRRLLLSHRPSKQRLSQIIGLAPLSIALGGNR